jgi:hypothetical protein
MKKPSAMQQLRSVNAWNAKVGVGDRVVVTKDDKSEFETVTKSEAWMLGGHTAVVMVEGISGGYMLSRVRAVELKPLS